MNLQILEDKNLFFLHPEKKFSAFNWFNKIFWFDELNFCSSYQTRLPGSTKTFGWTVLLTLKNILLMLQIFWQNHQIIMFWLNRQNFCWSSENILLLFMQKNLVDLSKYVGSKKKKIFSKKVNKILREFNKTILFNKKNCFLSVRNV